MSQDFETSKNVKAGTITGVISGVLFLLFFLVSWSAPVIQEPVFEEGMEVNLGIDDDGSGDIQPLRPGAPSAAEPVVSTPKAVSAPPQAVKAIETDDNDEEAEDVVVPKPTKPNPKTPEIPKETTVKNTNPQPQPTVEQPKPAPKPKATYKGGDGSGPGGNNADTWNGSTSEGNTTGTGDRGKINGDPNSKNYDGFGGSGNGNGSYTIQGNLRGRAIRSLPSFQDDFNENGKVAVNLVVDASGTVISATHEPKGTTITNASQKEIALRKARQIKFAPGEEQRGTFIFNFRVTN